MKRDEKQTESFLSAKSLTFHVIKQTLIHISLMWVYVQRLYSFWGNVKIARKFYLPLVSVKTNKNHMCLFDKIAKVCRRKGHAMRCVWYVQKTEMQISRTGKHNNRSLGIKWYTISVLLASPVLNFHGFYRLFSIEWEPNRAKFTTVLCVNRGNNLLYAVVIRPNPRPVHRRRMAGKYVWCRYWTTTYVSHIITICITCCE